MISVPSNADTLVIDMLTIKNDIFYHWESDSNKPTVYVLPLYSDFHHLIKIHATMQKRDMSAKNSLLFLV